MSSRMDVRVSVYSLDADDDWPWNLTSPNAIELRLFMCSIVSCAYWVRVCLIALPLVVGVTLGCSSATMESALWRGYFCSVGLVVF